MVTINVKDKLSLNTYKVAKESHLKIDQELCDNCKSRCCLSVCPAGVYTSNEQGKISTEFEACLECGTCLLVCPHSAIDWEYPKGGFGVQFKHG